LFAVLEDFGSDPLFFLAHTDMSHLYVKVQFIREPDGKPLSKLNNSSWELDLDFI
jgi:hypothetical protein